METFDTNVVLRLVYRDDVEQAERAQRAWETALATGAFAEEEDVRLVPWPEANP